MQLDINSYPDILLCLPRFPPKHQFITTEYYYLTRSYTTRYPNVDALGNQVFFGALSSSSSTTTPYRIAPLRIRVTPGQISSIQ